MNARYLMGTTLTLLLVLGGPARAVTANDIIDGASKAIDGVEFSIDDLLNPRAAIDRAIGAVFKSVPNTIIKAGLKDLLVSIKGTNAATKKIQEKLLKGKSLQSFVEADNAYGLAILDPLNSDTITKAGATNTKAFDELKQLAINEAQKIPKNESLAPGGKGNNLGLAIGGQVTIAQQQEQVNAAKVTGLTVAESEAYVTEVAGETAQTLNQKNNTQTKAAVKQLSQDTKNAVSTRATVQALNNAVATLMTQELFGNEQLQYRLNVLVKQSALTNSQLGDMLREMRSDDVKATAQQAARLKESQQNGINMANSVKNTAIAAGVAYTGAKVAVAGASGAVGEGIPSTSEPTVNSDGSVNIPVGSPKTSEIPQLPTASKPGANPVSEPGTSENKQGGTQAENVLKKLADKLNPPQTNGVSTDNTSTSPSNSMPQRRSGQGLQEYLNSATYLNSQEYASAKSAWDYKLREYQCGLRMPGDRLCISYDNYFVPTPNEIAETAKKNPGTPNPDKVDVTDEKNIPLF